MIDISGVKVGDRVRLTRKNEDGSEDKTEFTVTAVLRWGLDSAANSYSVSGWDHMERLKPPRKPHPTKLGLYIPFRTINPTTQHVWRLCADGTWLSMPYVAGGHAYPVKLETVEYYRRMGTLRYLETGQEQ